MSHDTKYKDNLELYRRKRKTITRLNSVSNDLRSNNRKVSPSFTVVLFLGSRGRRLRRGYLSVCAFQSAISDSQMSRPGDRSQSLPYGTGGMYVRSSLFYTPVILNRGSVEPKWHPRVPPNLIKKLELTTVRPRDFYIASKVHL